MTLGCDFQLLPGLEQGDVKFIETLNAITTVGAPRLATCEQFKVHIEYQGQQ
jgi:hypothetical protein